MCLPKVLKILKVHLMIWITIKLHIHLSKQRALLHPLTPNTVVKGCKSCSYKLVIGYVKDFRVNGRNKYTLAKIRL